MEKPCVEETLRQWLERFLPDGTDRGIGRCVRRRGFHDAAARACRLA